MFILCCEGKFSLSALQLQEVLSLAFHNYTHRQFTDNHPRIPGFENHTKKVAVVEKPRLIGWNLVEIAEL